MIRSAGPTQRALFARAFTLVELMVVIAVISILGAMLLGGLARARRNSNISLTQQTLDRLRLNIELHVNDFNDFPPAGGADGIAGSEALLEALRTEKKNGPYISLQDIKTCDSNGNGRNEIADSWGQPIHYLHHKDYGRAKPNRRSYRLYSGGPDRSFDSLNPNSDDIVNWKKGLEFEE